MLNLLLILITLGSGLLWLYDGIAKYPQRRKTDAAEPDYVAYARGTFLILLFIMLIRIFNVGILTLLTLLTIFSGIIWWIDAKWFRAARKKAKKKEPMLIDYSRSLFPIFFVVLIIRAFILQPFRVPSGSLEPTVMPGDFVAVSQFAYGLRLPITHTKILSIGEPKVGDIAVFRYPANPSIDFIKRIVGVPGDHVVYKNKTLYINGKKMKQTFIKNTFDYHADGTKYPAREMQENLNGIKHKIIRRDPGYETSNFDVVVPKGYYFAMGDNRDDSADSRFWGYVPEKNLIGKAFMIWMSWNGNRFRVRWNRIGDKL
jgi:signal peptidase I